MKTCSKIYSDKDCNLRITDTTFDTNFIQVFIVKSNVDTQITVRDKESQQIIYKGAKDGFYSIQKLTIPLDESAPYYYKDGKYYHNIKEVELQELANVNPEVSKISVEYIYYFSTCNLRNCYIKACYDIFDQQNSICNKITSDKSLTYKRDLIWSALNVINYMFEMGQIDEAQRLLEEITECNGLCPQTINNNSSGCGCNG